MARFHTISNFGERLLGYDNDKSQVGLEGAYSYYLKGKDISRNEQRINAHQWKPVNSLYLEPIPGVDIYTTIDIRLQNIVYKALLKQLCNFEAETGSAILMEVATGKVKAIVNLKKIKKSIYKDVRNYAIYDNSEPGSTFKIMSFLVAIDDGYINFNSSVDIENGKWKIHSMVVTDDYGQGIYDLKKILIKSSNVGISKLIYKYYSKNPDKFYKKLHDWKLDQSLNVEIKGESTPKFPSPKNKNWTNHSLITSSYGYGVNLTPLQILTFYNGIANNGVILQPKFLEKVVMNGKIVQKFKSEVRVKKIVSQEIINQMKDILVEVVKNGTAKSIYSPMFKMAGKTGTTRLEYWKVNLSPQYQSSFCGFFLADKPVFSCIVVIQKPKLKKGIYGGTVAAPVFKEIVTKTCLKMYPNLYKNFINKKK